MDRTNEYSERTFKKVRYIYKAILTDSSLSWLECNQSPNPLRDYEKVSTSLGWIRMWFILVTFLIFPGLIQTLTWQNIISHHLTELGITVIATLIYSALIPLSLKTWSVVRDSYIKANWESAKFYFDIEELLDLIGVQRSSIGFLRSNGYEAQTHAPPEPIKKNVLLIMLEKATMIKRAELKERQVHLFKENLKAVHELLVRLRLINLLNREESLEAIYSAAEKQVAAAPTGKEDTTAPFVN